MCWKQVAELISALGAAEGLDVGLISIVQLHFNPILDDCVTSEKYQCCINLFSEFILGTNISLIQQVSTAVVSWNINLCNTHVVG